MDCFLCRILKLVDYFSVVFILLNINFKKYYKFLIFLFIISYNNHYLKYIYFYLNIFLLQSH